MKKFLSLFLSLALILTSASVLAQTDGIKLGIVTPDADHGFTGESVAHARAEAEALKASGVIEDYMMAVGIDASKQIQGLDEILNWGPDVVVLWPMEGDLLRNAAQKVVDEEVPLIIYDRLIENFEGKAAEIMGDNEKIGNMMGEYLLKFYEEDLKAGKKINYLLFIGDSSTVSKQRTGGMLDVINATEFKDNFVLLQDGFQTDWSNAKSQEYFENWLTTADAATISDLDLIVTHDDEIVDGLMTVIRDETALTDLRLITSVGGRRETLSTFDEIEKPLLLTYYFSPSYIREAIRLGVAVAKGEQYQGQDVSGQLFLIPTIEVDKDTVEAFRNSQEFIDRYSIAN
ncbi:MAG: substrate-binding domain-containing protein [Eubacteriales bacterium]|jgi:ribose transport system substrate-binding protein|nr:substrate-binding domain-containing protein [Eubacteriales bacterium]MDD4105086.1 substrate-binding domain-containing protein [Eubacteriales bacterium]MDD4710353.1 substrate-binding domain-containing protein [Eubacteriales bacterium]